MNFSFAPRGCRCRSLSRLIQEVRKDTFAREKITYPRSSSAPELSQAELESLMAVYDRPLDDYLEMFIQVKARRCRAEVCCALPYCLQFGYVLLFSPAFPLAALCAVVNNVIEIRVDAFKLCNTVQRPFGRQVKDIGAWQKAMEVWIQPFVKRSSPQGNCKRTSVMNWAAHKVLRHTAHSSISKFLY